MKPDIPDRNTNYQVDGIEYRCPACGQSVAIQGEATTVRHVLCPAVSKGEEHPKMNTPQPCGDFHPLTCELYEGCDE